MGLTDEEYRDTGQDPREFKVPDWHKANLKAAGWRPCPEDEECETCGRRVQYGGELCCGRHLEENKLLAREDDGSRFYPSPSRIDYIERVEHLEGVVTETAAAMRVSGGMGWLLKHLSQFVLTMRTALSETKGERKRLEGLLVGVAEGLYSLEGTCALDSRDWSVNRRDAWLYGIICGWDDGLDEDPPEDAMAEMVEQHGWNTEAVERLRRMHRAVEAVLALRKEASDATD